jgi:UDP-N-acetyl-2-amino-2-deoxyglucuronate dehydrogenase
MNRMGQPIPSTPGRKVRFALIGCGRIAQNHFEAVKRHAERAELVAVADVDAAALSTAVAKTGARGFASLTELLAARVELGIDCIVLTTPSGLHPRQTIEAAQAGMHVMTEKPMATRWQDGLAMVKACDDAGVRLFVVKQNRRNSTLQLLKRAVSEGRFGRLYNVAVNVFWTRPQAYYDSAAWRGTWAMDGGSLMNQGIHYVDLLRWCMGPVTEVTAVCATQAHQVEVEDTALAIVRFGSGAVGTILSSTAAYPGFPQRLEITGTEGTVIIEDGRIVRRAFGPQAGASEAEGSTGTGALGGLGGLGAAADPAAIEVASHAAQIADLLAAIEEGRAPAVDGQAGRDALEIVRAVYESARTGAPVGLTGS